MEQIIQILPPEPDTHAEAQGPASCPEGWRKAGIVIPLTLTSAQEQYARQTLSNSRFVYNLALKTAEFHKHNRLPYPTVNALAKALNACKRQDYSFLLETSKQVAEGALREYRQALLNWWNPKHPAGKPTLKRKTRPPSGGEEAAAGIAALK